MKSEVTKENISPRTQSGSTGDGHATSNGSTSASVESSTVVAHEDEGTTEVRRVSHVSETTDAVDGRHSLVATTEVERHERPTTAKNRTAWIVTAVALVALAAIFLLWSRGDNTATPSGEKEVAIKAEGEHAGEEHGAGGEHAGEEGGEVVLEPEALASAGLEYEGVTQRPAIALLRVSGTVEPNPRNTQQVTPLVGGRVERVNVAVGDRVGAGTVIATISSPEIAEMHGKLHEAETAYELAQRNLQRVQRTENRVAVFSAKAKLDETEATLRRTRRLVELGAGAGKDLIAAEAAYRTAKAEYDFQNNISLNRELQEARAGVETTRVDMSHIRDQMRALGVQIAASESHDHSGNSSLVAVRAPASGIITERLVNSGAGISAGANLFTISNLASVYVIANVPEVKVGTVRPGTPAEIRSAALGDVVIRGRVSYIDPQLNEATRTARVRIEVPNPGERLRAGMFTEVGFQTTTGGASGEELVVPSSAIQRVENKTIVFIPKDDEPGAFEAREVETGGESDGYVRVLGGLKIGERVVTKGSFTLKTQMQKGEMGEHGH